MHHVAVARVAAGRAALSARAPLLANFSRAMSAGSKRNKKDSMPIRRAGGMTLPDDEHTLTAGGEYRSKSERMLGRESAREAREAASAEEAMRARFPSGSADDGEPSIEDEILGSPAERALAEHLLQREALRTGEQSWRERAMRRDGVAHLAEFKADRATQLAAAEEAGSLSDASTRRNPVLQRARKHLNPADLGPEFDHLSVPPLSAAEVDAKQRALHATFWNKYEAWKQARPDEHAQWLQRLKKREEEQAYHWQQAQGVAPDGIDALRKQQLRALLPDQHRASFQAALAADAELADAVKQLGEEEVLRRWSAFHAFEDARRDASSQAAGVAQARMQRTARARALAAEDPLATLNNPSLSLTLGQKKKLYYLMLGSQQAVRRDPFWTDPDPRYEGQHDWKQVDAFLKPPLLPPLHLLRHLSARPGTDRNFSSLHRFLHLERLRQTMYFLRESKKKQTRAANRTQRDMVALARELLSKSSASEQQLLGKYAFLKDALLSGAQNMYRSPWSQRLQSDFIHALHRNVIDIARDLDRHFSRGGKNAQLMAFPMSARSNADEPLRGLTQGEARRVEQQMWEAMGFAAAPTPEQMQQPMPARVKAKVLRAGVVAMLPQSSARASGERVRIAAASQQQQQSQPAAAAAASAPSA